MDKYHIYEAIGRGKCSTVYKGRKKKTIEYFAIKSVDKSQKSKVLQEVRILHTLDHSNVLRFYSWYETNAHLWLVLEYCVGGDLMTLLQQDSQLPEDSIHDLAYGIVKALQFLHSKGIIYCDLKPSNILLDENGHTKLCDFGLARRLGDISKTPSSSLPQAKRGTPHYMAPELFQEGGIHSYASDLWALGCVLYECYAGKPPFVGREFTQLGKSVISDPTPPLPGSPSRSFVSLVNSLLIKDPAERIEWADICGHAFWRTTFAPVPLPPQPAFDNMIELNSKPGLSERNGDKPLNKTPPRSRDRVVKGTSRQDENVGLRGNETPVKGVTSGRKTQTKSSARAIEEKHKAPSSATRAVNLLRLSRIAKSNLQRENEKENYRRPLPNDSENNAEVKIENTDMELDFNENAEDEKDDELDGSDNQTSASEEKSSDQPQVKENAEDMETKADESDTLPAVSLPISDDLRPSDSEFPSELADEVASPAFASPQVKTPRVKEGIREYDSSKSSNNLSEVLWHQSDHSVRPVMPSRKADKLSEAIPSLPFKALPAPEFAKLSKDRVDELSTKIIGILSTNINSTEKQSTIRYLEMLSNNGDAANILTNGPIMLTLVKMLRQSKISSLRVQVASLLGLLIRHSTFIKDSLASSGILDTLKDSLRDNQEKVRRFSMAALGELLFYISTQHENVKDNNPPESPSKDIRSPSGWQVSNGLISSVTLLLRKGEDDLTQLYALRTIENICSQGGFWAARFTSQDVINYLCYVYRAAGKQESMRLTAGSCLVRLVRFNPTSIQSAMEKLSFRDTASSLVKGSPREQLISLNLLNMAMLGGNLFTNIGRLLSPLAEDRNFVPSLVSLIEQGSEVLKGKALVFLALLCKNGRRWLPHFFCNARLLSAIDRLAKEKDSYVQQCLNASVHVVASTVPSLLETVSADIQQIMSGKRHGSSGFTSRASSKTSSHLFPVVLHLLGSSCFKHLVVSDEVLQQLASLIKLVESPFQGRDDFQIPLLRILESIAEEVSAILVKADVFIHGVLPSLSVMYKGNKDGDARFLCLKILFDVMVTFLDEPLVDEQRSQDLKFISNRHFLPLYPTLIEDEDPIPMYAQKLLVMLIEFNFIKISDILQLKTVTQCFEFLLGDLSSVNVNNVKLCLALTSAEEMENKILSQLQVVRRIGNLLEFVNAKDMEDFLEPTLELCKAFLVRAVTNREGFIYSKEPSLLSEGSLKTNSALDPQQSIRDIGDFSNNVGVLLELSASQGASVADIASECLVLLLKAVPREATTGLLSNLPKVTPILECSLQGNSHLPLLRMLHTLGYSCRQYMSQNMILSISISDLLRIEAIVYELRSSTVPQIGNAAAIVSMELQRLPRYN